jgi:hypothetical protein
MLACGHLSIMYGCPVLQLGAWFGKTEAVVSDEGTVLYAAAGGRFGVGVDATSWLNIALFGDLLGALRRPVIMFDNKPQWRHPAVSGAVGVQTIAFF